jgi:Protein of unknown function (DUF1592)/Protein of unknown function (DUF1588)/Protein of unknown function (DUF1595)/Protein of unknown function (DUF1585)/Protein of unknown function (DUF1587)
MNKCGVRPPVPCYLGLLASVLGLFGCATSEAAGEQAVPSIVSMRRLTEEQYRNSIADIFGADVKVNGPFERIVRPDQGLVATGASRSAISPTGFAEYSAAALSIADQVLQRRHRGAFVPCGPSDATTWNAHCAAAVYRRIGRYLFRRPLTNEELETYVSAAETGAGTTHDYYTGLKLGLVAMLVSPQFLYRVDVARRDGELDAYSKASRLSFLLWDTTPDNVLLTAAVRGDLDNPKRLSAQVDRLLRSPRFEAGARAFYSDFLGLEQLTKMAKDPLVYPRFNSNVAMELPEQLLRTVVDITVTKDEPYPRLFTSRETFMTRRLALIYAVPVAKMEGWQRYEFATDDRRAGILGQAAFLALYSHEGRSSPTLRGKAIREVLMCQAVPPPPANVNFSIVNDVNNPALKTARGRLTAHRTDPVCAGCHRIMDPIGLSLERFDGIGAARSTENGAEIDAASELDGQAFADGAGLGQLLSVSNVPTHCVARRAAEYATGRGKEQLPDSWINSIQSSFQSNGFRFRALLRAVATSPELYSTGMTKPAT